MEADLLFCFPLYGDEVQGLSHSSKCSSPNTNTRATRRIKKSQTDTVLPKRLSHLEVACGLVAIASTLGDFAGCNNSYL